LCEGKAVDSLLEALCQKTDAASEARAQVVARQTMQAQVARLQAAAQVRDVELQKYQQLYEAAESARKRAEHEANRLRERNEQLEQQQQAATAQSAGPEPTNAVLMHEVQALRSELRELRAQGRQQHDGQQLVGLAVHTELQVQGTRTINVQESMEVMRKDNEENIMHQNEVQRAEREQFKAAATVLGTRGTADDDAAGPRNVLLPAPVRGVASQMATNKYKRRGEAPMQARQKRQAAYDQVQWDDHVAQPAQAQPLALPAPPHQSQVQAVQPQPLVLPAPPSQLQVQAVQPQPLAVQPLPLEAPPPQPEPGVSSREVIMMAISRDKLIQMTCNLPMDRQPSWCIPCEKRAGRPHLIVWTDWCGVDLSEVQHVRDILEEWDHGYVVDEHKLNAMATRYGKEFVSYGRTAPGRVLEGPWLRFKDAPIWRHGPTMQKALESRKRILCAVHRLVFGIDVGVPEPITNAKLTGVRMSLQDAVETVQGYYTAWRADPANVKATARAKLSKLAELLQQMVKDKKELAPGGYQEMLQKKWPTLHEAFFLPTSEWDKIPQPPQPPPQPPADG